MLRELSLKAKRRVRERPAIPKPDAATHHHQNPNSLPSDPLKPNPAARFSRGLSAIPRRLSRGPPSSRISSFSRPSLSRPSLSRRRVDQPLAPFPPLRLFERRPGLTVPLTDVDALLRWRPTGLDARCVSSVPLPSAFAQRYVRSGVALSASIPSARGSSSALRRLQPARLLLCHDFRDGYHDWEAQSDGVQGNSLDLNSTWRFNHWAYVDVFVYFSHYCVTIPPVSFIHAAHRHGTLILGTLIFEHGRGEAELLKILQSFKSRANAARQLASIARFYGFDGWLVNIEVSLSGGSSAASDLAAFVADLTRAVRKLLGPVSEVIWFDAVTRDGSLAWQNELNVENEPFFKAAGSLFTNYCWDRNAPVRSAIKAGTRRTDVWTGIDVHGRNTFGGGGFHTHLALRAIKQGGTSAAIFAPAWTVEKCSPTLQDPRELEDRFWTGPAGRFGRECVAQYFRERAVLSALPFETCFDPGWGPRQMANGVLKSDEPYFNMSQQDVQPSFMREVIVGGDVTAAKLSLSHEQAYNGSASIKTEFAFSDSRMLTGSFSILRLIVANVLFPTRASRFSAPSCLTIRYAFQPEGENLEGATSAFGLALLFASPPQVVLLVGSRAGWLHRPPPRLQIEGKFVDVTVIPADSEEPVHSASDADEDTTGWITRTFALDQSLTSGQRLAEVLIIAGGPPSQPLSVNASPFMSPSASQLQSRLASRFGSRAGSTLASRRNTPPNERETNPIRQRPNIDTFGAGLLSKYRESFGGKKGFMSPSQDAPGIQTRFHGDHNLVPPNHRQALRFQPSYAANFAVDGNIDFGSMEEDGSASSSRPSSRFSSRYATPSGSRPLSRISSRPGSRTGSLPVSMAASRHASVAGSLAGSRQGSKFVSPVQTPATGGGGALPMQAAARILMQSRTGRSRSTLAEEERVPRNNMAISDLKSALMQAAGSMAGEANVGSEKHVVFLGMLKLETVAAQLPVRPPEGNVQIVKSLAFATNSVR